MQHDTKRTVGAINQHVASALTKALRLELVTTDGFDGETVEVVVVNDFIYLYPHEAQVRTLGVTVAQTKWAIDVLIDASDASVGIYGCEPENAANGLTFGAAISRVAMMVVANEVEASLERADEDELAEILRAEDAMAEEWRADEDELAEEWQAYQDGRAG